MGFRFGNGPRQLAWTSCQAKNNSGLGMLVLQGRGLLANVCLPVDRYFYLFFAAHVPCLWLPKLRDLFVVCFAKPVPLDTPQPKF